MIIRSNITNNCWACGYLKEPQLAWAEKWKEENCPKCKCPQSFWIANNWKYFWFKWFHWPFILKKHYVRRSKGYL